MCVCGYFYVCMSIFLCVLVFLCVFDYVQTSDVPFSENCAGN